VLYANQRNFFKVEKWTRDGVKVDSLLYGGPPSVPTKALPADVVNQGR
jgi:hypothetical protein